MKLNVTVDLIQDTEQKRLIDPIVHIKNKNVISLFSGCGGLDLGFEGGFKVLSDALNFKINPHWVIISLTKPKVFIAENVKGLVNLGV